MTASWSGARATDLILCVALAGAVGFWFAVLRSGLRYEEDSGEWCVHGLMAVAQRNKHAVFSRPSVGCRSRQDKISTHQPR